MSNFRIFLAASAASIAIAPAALAQSTGSIDFDDQIIVTGSRVDNGVAGVITPDTAKAKAVLTQEVIAHQVPGQSINDTINLLPGVSFQNNDPFGSAGGKLSIRGFDNTRISQTFDGVPLNDSGGYALYSNQQLDPELIEQVNVNLGSTDVDSPTAAATGSTVNYRTRNPGEDFGVKVVASAGEYDFFRVFGMVDTGTFTSFGTRAFLAASRATNDTVYGPGKIDKQQYNAKIYQPIGSNGDFISIAGHYNQNRNNFFGSVPLRLDTAGGRIVGPDSANRFPLNRDERFYVLAPCQTRAPSPGVATDDGASGAAGNTCGLSYDYRFNPSNTGNIRVNSKFTLADGLILTVDPSYQYVKANGGGTVIGREGTTTIGGVARTGFIDGTYYTGIDLNGDGDLSDRVRLLAPSQTQTHRFGVIASLRYDLSEGQSVRVAYSLDHARHRQTGELNRIQQNGYATDVFPVNDPIIGSNGFAIQKRDRLSYAILHQFSGEYRGEFFDALTVTAGIRAPFFKRILNNYCFTTSATANVTCFGGFGTTSGDTAYAAANPTYQGPQRREFKYDKILPNVGLVFDIMPSLSAFANYSKGLQVPGTDNLYQSFFYARGNPNANPAPETTDNFDAGLRYRSSKVQAQASVWYTSFKNRLAGAYDRDLGSTIYRNLGDVKKYGVDGSFAYTPIPEVSLYAFGSYLKSKIKDNVDAGNCTLENVTLGILGCTSVGQTAYFQTAGKRESGSPVYTFGGRVQANLPFIEVGVQAKRTGPRYVNDQNLPVFQTSGSGAAITRYFVYGAKAPAYTLVDVDVRVPLERFGLNDKTYLQFNLSNVFDKLYVGGFDGGTSSASTVLNANIGAPRTFIGSLVIGL